MKINCLCGEEINNETEFFHHIKDKHRYYSINMLYNLLIKIYEKIDKYDDGIWFHIFPQHTTSEVLVAELKSLLENEK